MGGLAFGLGCAPGREKKIHRAWGKSLNQGGGAICISPTSPHRTRVAHENCVERWRQTRKRKRGGFHQIFAKTRILEKLHDLQNWEQINGGVSLT